MCTLGFYQRRLPLAITPPFWFSGTEVLRAREKATPQDAESSGDTAQNSEGGAGENRTATQWPDCWPTRLVSAGNASRGGNVVQSCCGCPVGSGVAVIARAVSHSGHRTTLVCGSFRSLLVSADNPVAAQVITIKARVKPSDVNIQNVTPR